MADVDKTKVEESKEALIDHAVKFMESATKKSTIKEKLSSRKFWIAAVGCVTGILGMIGLNDNIVALIAFAVLELGSIIGYCIAEGMVDAASFQKLLDVVSQIVDMMQNLELAQNFEGNIQTEEPAPTPNHPLEVPTNNSVTTTNPNTKNL